MQTPVFKTFLNVAIKAQSKNITKIMFGAIHTFNKVSIIILYVIFIVFIFIGQLD